MKYAANRRLFTKTLVTVSTKSEVFLKDFFNKSGLVATPDAFTFPKEILKRNASIFWVLVVSEEME